MKILQLFCLFAIVALVSSCRIEGRSGDVITEQTNVKPDFIKSDIVRTVYDGTTNDLLTGGLGKTGLQAAAPPAFADVNNPTAAELRTRAIFNNYRALIDPTPNGGFGVLYGPNVNAAGVAGTGEGRIAGEEYLAYADDGTGKLNVTLMVQIPDTFNRASPCIITATSSGSRGVYGAIATSGEWALKNNCAVAYTDKGTGNGAHDLTSDRVTRFDGRVDSAATVGNGSQFTANISAADRNAFNAATPNRFAFKHAHSQQNPEKDWGSNTLQAVKFAFYILNEKFGTPRDNIRIQTIFPKDAIVIASSVSNGGGAALAAAEADTEGLIDGVAVAEPQVQVTPNNSLTIRRGNATVLNNSKGLLDFFTYANLYQPCAALAPTVASSPALAFLSVPRATARCTSLKAKGLLNGNTLAEQATESLQRLRDYGWEAETDLFHASHYLFAVPPVAVTYANTYSRASVRDNLCGFSYAATAAVGAPTTLATASAAQIFASGNGVPPTGGINLVNNNSVGGALLDAASTSPSTNVQDLNIDGAICMRNLLTGIDANAAAAQKSIGEVRRSGNLRGKPAIIVHGRADTLEPVNHTSRPYYGINKIVEGGASKLQYYEVTNAQHFDAFIGNAALAGYDTRLVPLHVYLNRALDAVYANLKNGTALPPSQVIRTTPRGGTPGAAPAITAANVPPIVGTPAAADAITFSGTTVVVPD